MTRPRLLDLFCGAGGAAIGYHRAGFEVVGVDIRPQPNYPGTFHQADAIDFLARVLDGQLGSFVAIHASPPCQGYSRHVSSRSSRWAGTRGKDEPRLIGRVRADLEASGLPYVIENVVGARDELRDPVLLCGTMFGLPIPRHRLFELSPAPLWHPSHSFDCRGVATRYAVARGWDPRDMTVTGKGRRSGTKERWAEVMGWPADVHVTQHGLREAIPPAYAEWVGRQLLAIAEVAA